MAISSAISSALIGLSTNTRRADVVAANVANAGDPTYARRELEGTDIKRVLDPVLLADRRLSDADASSARTRADYAVRLERAIGSVDQGTTLTQRVTRLDTALISAIGDPSSRLRLDAVARSAQELVTGFHQAQSQIQTARMEADREIGATVTRLNELLGAVENLNDRISVARHANAEAATLRDQRQKAIDEIAGYVSIRVVHRERGEVTLYTARGGVLVADQAARVGFEPTGVIAPHMTRDNGLLGGLTLNGRSVDPGDRGPLGGGKLSALFEVRDSRSVGLQSELDGIARDLTDRFGPSGPDATIPPSAPGLFSDEGASPVPIPAAGLAGRLALDPRVQPGSTEVWRLRDGLEAVSQGSVGDGALLDRMRTALSTTSVASDPALNGRAASVERHLSELGSRISTHRVTAERTAQDTGARNIALRELELEQGVDTDVELQTLLQVEQSYNANAQVLSVLDKLLQRLLNM